MPDCKPLDQDHQAYVPDRPNGCVYNRSANARVGYFGYERPLEQPPILLDDSHVASLAEGCNDWPDEDPMTPWDKTQFYRTGATILQQGRAGRVSQAHWATWLLTTGLAVGVLMTHTRE